MPKRTVVFVGTEDKLYHLQGFHNIFEENDWEVKDCTSIGKAQGQGKVDMLIVWAFSSFYVREYMQWKNRPKAIWCTCSPFDEVAIGAKSQPMTTPSQLYQVVLSIING